MYILKTPTIKLEQDFTTVRIESVNQVGLVGDAGVDGKWTQVEVLQAVQYVQLKPLESIAHELYE